MAEDQFYAMNEGDGHQSYAKNSSYQATIIVVVGSKLNRLCINIAFWFHPSAEDEVNVACFHPSAGGGLVYGTKEGKLRILRCDLSRSFKHEGSCFPDENMFEVPSYALEG
ncbi:unnamed protein product [Fraxinus pennsylvanica]|uniref:Uncharacterized protein n=1 Tax=Fraxinus pennsylvanica TaxID=56036 RepID=A0AAD1Z550_9LAMI|nr:unnamed protein product [Fraxinus pennsylvanica]